MSKSEALRKARARVTALRPLGTNWVYSSNSDGRGWRESMPHDYWQARALRSEMIHAIAADLLQAK